MATLGSILSTQEMGEGGGPTVWGDITGTLANQTDLQAALDAKAASAHDHTGTYEPADAAIQLHLASTSNPHGVTKAQVGLGSASDTADAGAITHTTISYTNSAGTAGKTATILSPSNSSLGMWECDPSRQSHSGHPMVRGRFTSWPIAPSFCCQ